MRPAPAIAWPAEHQALPGRAGLPCGGCRPRTIAFPGVAPGEKLAQAGPSRPGPAPARVDARTLPAVTDLLAAAVSGIGGAERPGQVAMAEAVERSIRSGEHLAVQAGTGTGKSLAYLVPAVAHALASGSAVVVATATIALQRQLIDRDLPRLATTLKPLLGQEPEFAILKGRRNYLCLHRLKSGAPEDPRDVLFDRGATSAVGQQVERVHEWAADTTTGDRDELVPGVDDRAWRQVSVSARECLGAQRCPFGRECYAEQARITAGKASVVVTNHALLAINALESFPVLPEHDVVIIDEAHDLVNRVTSAASGELSATGVDAAARRVGRLLSADAAGGSGRRARRRPGPSPSPGTAASTSWMTTCPVRWPWCGTPQPGAPPRSGPVPSRRVRKRLPSSKPRPARHWLAWTTWWGPRTGSWPRTSRTSPRAPTWSGWTGRWSRIRACRSRYGWPRCRSARCSRNACSAARPWC